jgi:glyoxylase I family protein
MKNGFHHVALSAADIDKTIAFYQQAFGFTVLRRWGMGEKEAAMLDMGDGSILEMFSGGDTSTDGQSKWLHFAVATDDTDLCYKQALEAGGTSHSEPNDLVLPGDPPTPVRIAFVRGLNGELIEIFDEKK